jgi:hypothetical protein
MLSVAFFIVMLSVIVLSVAFFIVMLSVVMLNVVARWVEIDPILGALTISQCYNQSKYQCSFILSVAFFIAMISVIMLSVVILDAIV